MGLIASLKAGIEKIKNIFITDEIATASMIMAAWVTAADGKIKESEIEETEHFINEADEFKDLDKKPLTKLYRKWCDKFIKDPEDAVVHALMEIHPLKDKPEGISALHVAVKIARSDGDFCEAEQQVVTRACHYLGVDAEKIKNYNG